MAREAPLVTGAGRLAILAVAMVGAHAAQGAGADVSGFVGVWTFQDGSAVQATCAGSGMLTQTLSGVRASIYPGNQSDLIFDLGCSCMLRLDVAGSRATLAAPQQCLIISKSQELTGEISALILEQSSNGELTFTFSGANGDLGTPERPICPLSALAGSGTLVHTDATVVICDPDDAVGVVPYSPAGIIDCPLGAGLEDLRIEMIGESDDPCADETGSRGEGTWVLPDDPRRGLPVCGIGQTTTIAFCRVGGALFRSMTTALAPEQFYAVLKLGDRCPNGSVEISKTIDNEDDPGALRSSFLGNLGSANEVVDDPLLGTITKLTFCYFRSADSPDGVMTSFPDIGIPYAVFHAYAGAQPPWVMVKRWIYSNDEDHQFGVDGYDPPDGPAVTEFQGLVENPGLNTTFNLARVR